MTTYHLFIQITPRGITGVESGNIREIHSHAARARANTWLAQCRALADTGSFVTRICGSLAASICMLPGCTYLLFRERTHVSPSSDRVRLHAPRCIKLGLCCESFFKRKQSRCKYSLLTLMPRFLCMVLALISGRNCGDPLRSRCKELLFGQPCCRICGRRRWRRVALAGPDLLPKDREATRLPLV